MSGLSPTAVTFGEALLRFAAPAGQRLEHAPQLHHHVAGSEANVAAALAQLGVRTRWISRLPASPLGRRVERELRSVGVRTDAVQWADGGERLGLFFSDTGVDPRPTAVYYDRTDSAFSRMTELPAGVLDGAQVAHLSGITPALGDGPRAASQAFVARAREAGARVTLDVNYRSRLWTAEQARATLAPLAGAVDVLVCGQHDAREVFRLAGEGADLAERLRASIAPRARLVVVTLGERGSAAVDDQGRRYEQPAIPATIVDRFGMGDAFVAGLLWSLLREDHPAAALHAGATLAAHKASLLGDIARIELADLERALGVHHREMIR